MQLVSPLDLVDEAQPVRLVQERLPFVSKQWLERLRLKIWSERELNEPSLQQFVRRSEEFLSEVVMKERRRDFILGKANQVGSRCKTDDGGPAFSPSDDVVAIRMLPEY